MCPEVAADPPEFLLRVVGSVGGWHSCRELSAPFPSGKEAVSDLRHISKVQVKYFWPRRVFRVSLSGS